MADPEQVQIFKQGVEAWNQWRRKNSRVEIDLQGMECGAGNYEGVNLSQANLRGSHWVETNLTKADLGGANLQEADITDVTLDKANLKKSNLAKAKIQDTTFVKANLSHADVQEAKIKNANFFFADLTETNFNKAHCALSNFSFANFFRAAMTNSTFGGSYFYQALLTMADLRNSSLVGSFFTKTDVTDAKISNCDVYGVSVWDLEGEFAEQENLNVALEKDSTITVDNIKVAQFIYMIITNREIQHILNTLNSKTVLILGRFALPQRKRILDALRKKLREYDLVPIVFDFDRPTDKDFTETIKTLAGLSYFVIADVTNPKSSPLELQATVPDYQIPFVPIIQEGEKPFAMMVDLQKKYNWVLDTLEYDSLETLIAVLKPAIIDPAIEKHNELRGIKARSPKTRYAKDFLPKGSD